MNIFVVVDVCFKMFVCVKFVILLILFFYVFSVLCIVDMIFFDSRVVRAFRFFSFVFRVVFCVFLFDVVLFVNFIVCFFLSLCRCGLV